MDAQNFWYAPFCGEPGDFDESISVADLISGEISADYFAGKIVFIGPYTIGLQDNYITSIDHARQMHGVEFLANAVQALLWGEYKRELGDRTVASNEHRCWKCWSCSRWWKSSTAT